MFIYKSFYGNMENKEFWRNSSAPDDPGTSAVEPVLILSSTLF